MNATCTLSNGFSDTTVALAVDLGAVIAVAVGAEVAVIVAVGAVVASRVGAAVALGAVVAVGGEVARANSVLVGTTRFSREPQPANAPVNAASLRNCRRRMPGQGGTWSLPGFLAITRSSLNLQCRGQL
jgi:hypothetical protein